VDLSVEARVIRWPLEQQQQHPAVPMSMAAACGKQCVPGDGLTNAVCAFDTRVCALLSAVFATPAVEPQRVPIFNLADAESGLKAPPEPSPSQQLLLDLHRQGAKHQD
jgi:hypothetical protein